MLKVLLLLVLPLTGHCNLEVIPCGHRMALLLLGFGNCARLLVPYSRISFARPFLLILRWLLLLLLFVADKRDSVEAGIARPVDRK